MRWKRVGIVLLLFIVTVAMCVVSYTGIDSSHTLSVKNIDLGLDLAGGVSIVYEAEDGSNPTTDEMEGALAVIQRRLDNKGYTEASAYIDGTDRIRVDIPGVDDVSDALDEIGRTAQLTFIGVDWDELIDDDDFMETYYQLYVDNELAELDEDELEDVDEDDLYDEAVDLFAYLPYYLSDEECEDYMVLILEGAVEEGLAEEVLTGSDIESASYQYGQYSSDGSTGAYVSLTMTSEGADKFAEATETYLDAYIAILLDDDVCSMPTVNSTITDGEAIITGLDDEDEAKSLASDINGGALPVNLEVIQLNSVGATLGQDALRTSIIAAAIGFIIILIFMCVYYKIPGIASALALCLYVGMLLIAINVLNLTLTLSGIAGMILSVGMAVDANVIIFSRITEELKAGRRLKVAIHSGFQKAYSAVLDGNITTLIVALVLYVLGSGTVRGFAQTLALGIVLSMFTALVITRLYLLNLSEILTQDPKYYTSLDFFSKVRNKVTGIVEKFKIWVVIPVCVIVVGIIFFAVRGGFNLDVEFAGGTLMTIDIGQEFDAREDIEPLVQEITGDTNPQVQAVSDSTSDYMVSIKVSEMDTDTADELYLAIAELYGLDTENNENLIELSTISPTVSSEMRSTAVQATIVSVILMLIYITFRFRDVLFGVSSLIALVHDVIIVLCMYVIFQIPVNNNFIAALLTIVGYSINNTIVIFDRVRENRRYYSGDQIVQLGNESVSQSIGRSINTSLTTIVMVLFLFILGVRSIRWFAFPLLMGFIAGTYSSIFIATPVWVQLSKLRDKHSKKSRKKSKNSKNKNNSKKNKK